MGETFQLYLKSECTGLIFCAIDLNPRKIMRLKKKSFSLDYLCITAGLFF